MMVRVFTPKECDPDDGSNLDGTDHEFPVIPEVGHVIRFTDNRNADFTVKKVLFLQDSGSFIPCVYTEKISTPVEWIDSFVG